eukprot:Pgem_evm1s3365
MGTPTMVVSTLVTASSTTNNNENITGSSDESNAINDGWVLYTVTSVVVGVLLVLCSVLVYAFQHKKRFFQNPSGKQFGQYLGEEDSSQQIFILSDFDHIRNSIREHSEQSSEGLSEIKDKLYANDLDIPTEYEENGLDEDAKSVKKESINEHQEYS